MSKKEHTRLLSKGQTPEEKAKSERLSVGMPTGHTVVEQLATPTQSKTLVVPMKDTNMIPEKLNQDMSKGGVKFDLGKVPLDLLPVDALLEIGKVLDYGAQKYSSWNWAKGMSQTRLMAAALRHIFAWLRGEDLDPETQLSHIAHAGCCILFLLTMISRKDQYKKFDDRFRWDEIG